MVQWWKDLSVSKKLYAVVGVMALLIATELFTLLFAMDILSSVRGFVGAEGLWSKAQKNASYSLQRYGTTHDPVYWDQFKAYMRIPDGYHQARIEMSKPDFDYNVVRAGFLQGGVQPDDVNGLVQLIRRFYWVSYISKALQIWTQGDGMLVQLLHAGERMQQALEYHPARTQEIEIALREVDLINASLTTLEADFSSVLGEGSRWLESVLMSLLILAVLCVESTGLFLTITFSRTLSRSLGELMESAQQVGQGNFNIKVPVRSQDELGQLATTINKMNDDLDRSVGARREAENANQIKSMFLANMSHEIRTPLGVILGLAEVLKESDLESEKRLQYVETISRTGQNLTRIINDILDLSKVEAGHLEIERSRFSLSEFLTELESMLVVQATKTENQLRFLAIGSQPEFIFTDRNRLRQILVNLVNNALKFTRRGSVTVSYRLHGTALIFQVSDTGVGIADGDQRGLFEPFEQGEGAYAREGTGLGLMLSRRLARALGGDVYLVATQAGKGSTFEVSLPALERARLIENPQDVKAIESTQNQPLALSGHSVLVVEDSEDNQELVRMLLKKRGMSVDFAANGREGMERALHKKYDVVLMDMQMPVMDGYRATRQLRDGGYVYPIIALTAHAMKEDRERCLAAGCDDYLTKPIDSARLYEAIARQL